ncbi:class I fructose-bisphosphate aldolase [Mesoaciditoga lauensis]|uniref:class I fructose-bisphosphate aldolase n=1 Tax=Mesoaciditoga lauensis TaxID=1495039 RepID=UPI00056C800D|nr:fructose-bisphosphate aldolase [Mesoaciditoga lauensis]
MNIKEFRISKLLNSKSGKSVVIPIDHGLVMGNITGLSNPIETLKKLIELKIDATLMSPGLAKITLELFASKDAPARILTMDIPLMSTIPGETGEVIGHETISTVEFAIKYGFDSVKVLLPWGEKENVQMESIRVVSRLATECDKWQLPLMVEPVLWGNAVPKEKKKDPTLIEHAARMALELGADILKIPYTGNQQEFKDLINSLRVPIFILGGPKMNEVIDTLKVAEESVRAGAKGVVFGRNVWQNSQMEMIIKSLQMIVHDDMDANEVIKSQIK